MKLPLLTGFCGGLAIFVGCAYLGHRAGEIATCRWKKPTSFESLKKPNDGQLRDDLLTLQGLEFSKFNEDTPSALQKNVDYLGTMRSGKRPELSPVVDLQMATDYAEMARLERDAGNLTMADRHHQMAESILHSLGWQDTSSDTVAKLTHGQLWWKRAK